MPGSVNTRPKRNPVISLSSGSRMAAGKTPVQPAGGQIMPELRPMLIFNLRFYEVVAASMLGFAKFLPMLRLQVFDRFPARSSTTSAARAALYSV